MDIIAIGDIHGRDVWKEIIKEDADKFVFIGDYVDTHERISPGQQARNFEEILEYKQENPDDVVLLLGNHDYHYLPGINVSYSGFQGHMLPVFRGLLKRALNNDLVQACYEQDGVVYSHAGITKTWADDNNIDTDNLQGSVNECFDNKTSAFGFQRLPDKMGYGDPYGNNIFQSPMWVRPESLSMDKIHGYKQVVGHTTKDEIKVYNDIAFIDTLGTSGEYLSVKDGEFKVAVTE